MGPFLGLSFAAGVFALLPYFALWAPLPPSEQNLPPKSELVRRNMCVVMQFFLLVRDRQSSLLHATARLLPVPQVVTL